MKKSNSGAAKSSIRNGSMCLVIAAGLLALAAPAEPARDNRAARAADGHADLSGIWEALDTANWDLEDHSAQAGPLWQTGAIGAEPAGQGVVEGGAIPYLPAPLAQKKANFDNRRSSVAEEILPSWIDSTTRIMSR